MNILLEIYFISMAFYALGASGLWEVLQIKYWSS